VTTRLTEEIQMPLEQIMEINILRCYVARFIVSIVLQAILTPLVEEVIPFSSSSDNLLKSQPSRNTLKATNLFRFYVIA
jgi:hypothetical protein